MAVSTSTIGIYGGRNPLEYSSSSPYTLFLFQAIFIILLCQFLHFFFKKIQQPKVIAEVIAGILLGPSVMGKIPNFTDTCFNKESIPNLTLFANIGIILFLFIVGLEVDLQFIKSKFRVAMTVGLINMAIPFALGCGIARGLYNEYHSDTLVRPIKFTTYMVFIAVAMCITAFPVLARILTELNLIGDRVGSVVLAAGIANDLTGWILLALVVTLANASNPVSTVYILLTTFGWFLFLCYPVRLSLNFYLKRYTRDLVKGEPSQFSMAIIIVLVFISAFFTDIIGVHPIFGAFMVGVIIPRKNGFVISITEKLEDVVHLVFVPIYFALSGLSVNLGLLNRGIDWAYIIGIIGLAMFGKIAGGFIAAKFNKLLWRESLAVGVLMSCKGIVEIVVLNVGLNAEIISQRVYSMFIVMALVTTFATTPLTLWVYPVWYRQKVDRYMKGEIDWDGNLIKQSDNANFNLLDSCDETISDLSISELSHYKISKIIVLIRKIDSISHLMAFIKIFMSDKKVDEIKAIHLREFSSRTSHLLEASSSNIYNDVRNESNQIDFNNSSSILSIVKAFSDVLKIKFTSDSILTPSKNYLLAINDKISDSSNLLITSTKAPNVILKVDNDDSNSDYNLFRRLFADCKSHIGLFIINENSYEASNSTLSYDSEYKTPIINECENHTSKTLLEIESINLVLKYDDVISSSDLLCLYLIFAIAGGLKQINIFLKAARGYSNEVESEFESLIRKMNSSVNINFIHIDETRDMTETIMSFKKNLSQELFVVSNNSHSNEVLFDEEVEQLIRLSMVESFNVLAVKSAPI